MNDSLIDTDILTLYQHGHPAVCARCAAHPAGALHVSIISLEEQFSGWYTKLRRCRTAKDLATAYERMTSFFSFVGKLSVLSFSEAAILRYEHLKSMKLNVGKKDLRIAAIAFEANAVLITRNLRDFQRIPGLVIQDWSA